MAEASSASAQERQRRTRRDQHGDVGQACRAPPLLALVVDGPLLGVIAEMRDGDRQVGGFELAQLVGPRRLVRPAEQERAMVTAVGRGPIGAQRLVGGLTALDLVGHQLAEQPVDPVDDGTDRAEVGDQPHQALPRSEAVAGAKEQLDVGSSEPVDRLLRIADEEQATLVGIEHLPRARFGAFDRRGDEQRQVDLDGVGVLELVEQQLLIAVVQHVARPQGGSAEARGPAPAGRGTRAHPRRGERARTRPPRARRRHGGGRAPRRPPSPRSCRVAPSRRG